MGKPGEKMDNLKNNIIIGMPVVQNKQDFVVSVFTIGQIFKFTKFTKRFIVGYDEKNLPIYNDQIQRFVEKPRVQKISDFLINDPDATFPTNLVLHIPREIIIRQTENNDMVEIELEEKVFSELKKENGNVYITIIDGQHRIKGIELAIGRLVGIIQDLIRTLEGGKNEELAKQLNFYRTRLDDLRNIQIVVTFFIDKTLEYQAMIFSTINRTQKKVSADLVSSLFGLNTGDTPQKTALQVALSLNGHQKSPFYKRIKLYGGSYSRENSPPLSQATMVNSIVRLISENSREAEKDRYKKRKHLHKRSPGSAKFLPFRKYYAEDNDSVISDILFHYFSEIRKIFKNSEKKAYWDFGKTNKSTNIFHTTVGYDSLLKILVDILDENREIITDFQGTFNKYLKKARYLEINKINRYSFNNRGKKFLYLDMSLAIWPPDYLKNPKDKREQELRELEQNK